MSKRLLLLLALACISTASAQSAPPKEDVFKGKLFAPGVILENQFALGLSQQQFMQIKQAVVEVQANVAEHEWDVREAYGNIMAELDESPIDEALVLEYVAAALQAENEVKKLQVTMLIRLRNLLTDDQVAYLESLRK